jgi:demethylmenaquinone methyltransferase/2-methoxy-6-polyprenyl-1,4-benzoquinol methylase
VSDPARPPQAEVVRMFDRIAPAYDAMNTLMTAGIDRRWRRATIAAVGLRPGMRVLDVATGTGKLALAAAERVGRAGEVVGLDPSVGMLERARRAAPATPGGAVAAVEWVEGDGMALPFPDGRFDAVTIGFGLRNLPDPAGGIREMARVCAAGGRVAVLEIAEPRGGVGRLLFTTWFRRVVPWLGRIIGRGSAYAYLPESLGRYPSPEEVARMFGDAGLEEVRWRRLTTGLATLHVGVRGHDR